MKGKVNGTKFIKEIVISVTPEEKFRIIGIKRNFENDWYEFGNFYENWANWEKKKEILVAYSCAHENEHYKMKMVKKFLSKDELKGGGIEFYNVVISRAKRIRKNWEDIQIWKKEFEVYGKLPNWKREIAPVVEETSGRMLEIGIIIKQGHGDWYKMIEYENGDKFLIIEEGFEIGEFYWNERKISGKKKYNLRLFKIKDTKEAIEILKEFRL